MYRPYPFHPNIKNHLLIAFGLAVWIFCFLYFTEPLDVQELNAEEKLSFLPLYGLVGALCYLLGIPLQAYWFQRNQRHWPLLDEILLLVLFCCIAFVCARGVYLYVIVPYEPNPYTLAYFLFEIYIPAIVTILPIVILGRWAMGKYHQKQVEKVKIHIEGEGNYEGLRIFEEQLICINSADNYIEVHFKDGNRLKKQVIRNTLSAIANAHPKLLRTHRSYLINPIHFQSWQPENGRHIINMSEGIEVPVSKSFFEATKSHLQLAPN